jgi:hypothetical protein
LISDFLLVPSEIGETAGLLLMKKATQLFIESRVDLVGGLMFQHTQEYKIMRRAGYFATPERFAPQSITLIIHTILDQIPANQLLNAESWFISNADHDAV